METLTLVGCQFGDEGKGKIIDFLSKDYDLNVRFNGGENAGHTVVVGDRVIKYHLVPAGFLSAKSVVIASGVVVNLRRLVQEIEFLRSFKSAFDLRISEIAHVVTELHFKRDKYLEGVRGKGIIGTTLKGIGPAYESKYGRYGIRLLDFEDRQRLVDNLALLSTIYQIPIEKGYVDELLEDYEKIRSYLTDARSFLQEQIDDGKSALFETAQGTFIDIESGTYPFVTSSYTTSGGVTVGTGLPPKYFKKFMGVAKAYTTRVGEGMFPTEIFGTVGDQLRMLGSEYGSTTGRPRRVGYLDLPMLRRAVRLNGLDYIALTKVDVLGKLKEVKVAVSYEQNGTEIEEFDPTVVPDKINYESFTPWEGEPSKLQSYIEFIESELKVPIVLLGIGEKREEIEVRGQISFD
jgi:adenylosuccinate synthase